MSDKNPNILIIPIDNRPVCYDLPLQAADIFKGLNIYAPDISLLGDLNKDAEVKGIMDWTKNTVETQDTDIAIIALDTVAYGGLIPSRRTPLSFDEIKKNIDDFVAILKSCNKDIKIYAVSSIMRISNNNINEEEKSYWDKYGRDIFRYSYLAHKLLKSYDVELEAEMIELAKKIPFEVIDDYLNTRKRNFDINSYYIDLVKNGTFSHLAFSQDDTAEYGFNVEEKELLVKQSVKELISPKITVKTGADEMVLSLMARALTEYFGENIKFGTKFFEKNVKDIVSRYEDISIEASAKASIEFCGGEITTKNPDINLLINAPNKVQDEICLGIYEDDKSTAQADKLIKYLSENNIKYAVADVKNANGADNHLLENFMAKIHFSDLFYGFGAWNTTGNTLGTVIAIAIIKELAQRHNAYNGDAFKKSQYIRLMDDWAYQANVRKILRDRGDTSTVKEDMRPYEEKTAKWLGYTPGADYSFPWDRTFEVKINL